MGILFAFAPFVVFFVLLRLVSPFAGVGAAFLISALTLYYGLMRGQRPKILEFGSILLFGALSVAVWVFPAEWSVGLVRLVVDGGLSLIALVSLAVGRPFTLQYARERVQPEYWNAPLFIHANRMITMAWTAAFIVATLCDAAATYAPAVPLWFEIAATVGALAGAIWFTNWYPARIRRNIPGAQSAS